MPALLREARSQFVWEFKIMLLDVLLFTSLMVSLAVLVAHAIEEASAGLGG